MNFSSWFAQKIAQGKSKKNKLSGFIIRIGQVAVALGVLVSLITLSFGVGARKAIQEKLADFNGHIVIKTLNSNVSFSSDSISLPRRFYPKVNEIPEILHIQKFATKSGVIRTTKTFEGVVFKGVGTDFDRERFEKFMVKGRFPKLSGKDFSMETVLSEKVANALEIPLDSSFVMFFMQNNQKPIYRRFRLVGTYRTDVKFFDDVFLLGDIRHIQRINKWDSLTVGGFEVFVNDIETAASLVPAINDQIDFDLRADSAFDQFQEITDWIMTFKINIAVILIIMLVVVVINMVMVFVILVIERTPSIGLLKTLGASNGEVVWVFIYYALYIMLPGMLVGNLLAILLLGSQKLWGWLTLPSPENYFLSVVPVYFEWWWFLVLNGGMLAICAIVLLLPSAIIARTAPTKALRFQ